MTIISSGYKTVNELATYICMVAPLSAGAKVAAAILYENGVKPIPWWQMKLSSLLTMGAMVSAGQSLGLMMAAAQHTGSVNDGGQQ